MEMLKPCSICGKKIAKYSCISCGSIVCDDHYDKKSGLCQNCPIKK